MNEVDLNKSATETTSVQDVRRFSSETELRGRIKLLEDKFKLLENIVWPELTELTRALNSFQVSLHAHATRLNRLETHCFDGGNTRPPANVTSNFNTEVQQNGISANNIELDEIGPRNLYVEDIRHSEADGPNYEKDSND